ncbi:F-box protein At5g03100 isoform X2 [Brachypodium distachyon]|uniref:F-box domain-containing protein n=1 Tax=Brachypodium distachyon TaxID=15368 RepID=A0A0Q3HR01_BRADI|nr:F-box protein At5g03100 isoform X2 [Brachypodium distachyon]KQJ95930.1 hypothetical protein BRADI_3g19800v3 [Brachypodium distachyon]|eukprot:XP_003573659.2 F-box protein At5g03100 isoform X2 [Brachypodium distachyon]
MTIPRSPGVTGFWALVRILSQYDQHQHETLIDLPEVAARLEQRIFVIAANLVDYNDKASKRLTYLETIVPHDRVKLRTSLFQLALPEKMEQKQPSRPQMIESSAEMLLRQSSSDEQNKINPARRNLPEVSSCVPSGKQMKSCCDDRISFLHESILHHIMSFMPARDVVRTSVLSPRWRPLWTSAPCLDINIDHFNMDRVKFNEFAESLFLCRGIDTLDILRLHSFAISAANFWIDHAINRKAKSIEFTEYKIWEPFYLNPGIIKFHSSYLRSLKLTNVILVTCIFHRLNHACPSLENLQLADSTLELPEISSRSLKTLEIIDCSVVKHLLIRTHKLVSLRFEGSRCRCTSKSILLTPSAVTLCDLSNAESIELSASVRQVAFDGVSTGRSMFINLRSLSLGEWCLSNNLSPILCFLRHSPLLEKLNLKLKLDCEKDEQTIQTARGISFAAEHLEKVTIYCTEGDARVPVLVNILRINARSLDRIDVKTY